MRCFCISIKAMEQSWLFVSQKGRLSLHLKSNINAASLKRRLMRFRLTNGCKEEEITPLTINISLDIYSKSWLFSSRGDIRQGWAASERNISFTNAKAHTAAQLLYANCLCICMSWSSGRIPVCKENKFNSVQFRHNHSDTFKQMIMFLWYNFWNIWLISNASVICMHRQRRGAWKIEVFRFRVPPDLQMVFACFMEATAN